MVSGVHREGDCWRVRLPREGTTRVPTASGSVRLRDFVATAPSILSPGSGDGRRSGDRRRNTGALGHERHRLRLRCGSRRPGRSGSATMTPISAITKLVLLLAEGARSGTDGTPDAVRRLHRQSPLGRLDDRIDADSRSSLLPTDTALVRRFGPRWPSTPSTDSPLRDAGGNCSSPDGVSQTPVTSGDACRSGPDRSMVLCWGGGHGREPSAEWGVRTGLRERNGTTLVTSATGKWSAISTTGADRLSRRAPSRGARLAADAKPLKSGNLEFEGDCRSRRRVGASVTEPTGARGARSGAGDLGDQWVESTRVFVRGDTHPATTGWQAVT